MRKIMHALAVGSLAAVFVLVGCSSSDSAGTGLNPPPPSLPSPQIGEFPTGDFASIIEAGDVPAIYSSLVGRGLYTFHADASWEFTLTDTTTNTVRFEIEGYVSVTDNQVKFVDQVGGSCQNAVGTYTWAFDDPELRFTHVSDACDGRSIGLTTHPYVEQ